MGLLQLNDNRETTEVWKPESREVDKANLSKIANIKINELEAGDGKNLLVFPGDLKNGEDKISEQRILTLSGDKISTGNIMGFVGVNDTQVDIRSRFAKDDSEDYFLHYMLQKVFSINLFDIKHASSSEPIFDFLIYLFPYFLKRALVQGIFKKYRRFEHNDAAIKGAVNVARHIRENTPFRGTVAYTSRELSYDNELTQLVRHTIEYIKCKQTGQQVLNSDSATKEAVTQIVMATQTYNLNSRHKIVSKNLQPVRHPYFTAYAPLQKLCLQILRHDSIKYGSEKDKIYGILFDGAWLWEEYLNTVLKQEGFKHPKNKTSEGGFQMFDKPGDDDEIAKNSRRLYPDFYKDDYIVDAKYKHLNAGVGREDLYQVVTYMYCKQAERGAYIYPLEKLDEDKIYKLNGYGGYISVIPFYVPQQASGWEDFKTEIEKSENELKTNLNKKLEDK